MTESVDRVGAASVGDGQLLNSSDAQQVEPRCIVRPGLGGVDDHVEVHRLYVQNVAVEGDRADHRILDGLATCRAGNDLVSQPQLSEAGAAFNEFAHQCGQALVARVPKCGTVQVRHHFTFELRRRLRVEMRPGFAGEKVPPRDVPFPSGMSARVAAQGGPQVVPDQRVPGCGEHADGSVGEAVEHPLDAGSHRSGNRAKAGSGRTGEQVQGVTLLAAQAKRSRKRLHYLRRRILRAPLLESYEVVDGHSRERREFFPSQPRYSALAARGKPDRCGRRPVAPCAYGGREFASPDGIGHPFIVSAFPHDRVVLRLLPSQRAWPTRERDGEHGVMTTTLITGSNKGLGRETARRLLAEGHTVYVSARDADAGRKTAEELGARFVLLDVNDDSSVAKAAESIRAEAGRLDVLVNNAGISGGFVQPADLTGNDLDRVLQTNVVGLARVTHAFLPLLGESHDPVIVNLSSGLASFTFVTDPDNPLSRYPSLAYSVSKSAVTMFTVQLAKAVPNIRVNAVDPGYTATALNGFRGTQTVEEAADVIVRLATIGAAGPTGTFQGRDGVLPW